MRILTFNCGGHDAAAAAFDDYELVAAVQEERLRREKGWGSDIPWLAIDDVLRIAGWTRSDVDVIAQTRGTYPTQYLRMPFFRDHYYTAQRRAGTERTRRAINILHYRTREPDSYVLFRSDRFLDDNAFRPDVRVYFADHHEAHALSALFHTDWDDALLYTSDGVGDNISYSIRALGAGRLECHLGGENMLAERSVRRNSLATAYAYATAACGFRMYRHEGKLTGLSARGEPKLADAFGRLFRLGKDGLVETDFHDWHAMEARRARGLPRARPRDHLGLDSESDRRSHRGICSPLARTHRPPPPRAGGRAVCQCPAQSPAGRDAAAG